MLQEVLSSFENSLPKQGNESDTKLDNLTNTKRLFCLYTSTNQISKPSCYAADCAACCAVGGAAFFSEVERSEEKHRSRSTT